MEKTRRETRLQYTVENGFFFFLGGLLLFGFEWYARDNGNPIFILFGGLLFLTLNLLSASGGILLLAATEFAFLFTVFELFFGGLFNLLLKMNLWNYSSLPLEFYGQICLPASLIALLSALPLLLLCRVIRRFVFFAPQ